MQIFEYIQFGVLVCAIIGMIVSFLRMAGFIPGAWIVFAIWVMVILWNLKVVPHSELIGFCLVALAAWLTVAWEKFRVKAALQPVAPSKKPWLSKTILINAVVAAGLLAEANVSSLQGFLPATKYQIVAFVLPIVNMLLRAYTTKGLSFKPALPQDGATQ